MSSKSIASIFICSVVLSSKPVIAAPILTLDDVKVVDEVQSDRYFNIPMIQKKFSTSSVADKPAELKKCQEWVLQRAAEVEPEGHLVGRCLTKIDRVLREFTFVGQIMFKTW